MIISLSLLGNSAFSQEIVQINFYKNSPGDIDLIIKDILEENGYHAFVKYDNPDDSINLAADYELDYTAFSRENYDELHEYTLQLSKNGEVINQVNKTISYINAGVSPAKELRKGLSRLFGKNFAVNNSIYLNNQVKYFNIQFQVRKIDDGKYIIIAKGAGIRSLNGVKEAFFKKAGQYLSSYDYFIETGQYEYLAHGGMMTTRHTGHMAIGIIIRNSSDEIRLLEFKPEELEQKLYRD